MATDARSIGDGKAAAALSYLLVGIIWYLADDKMRSNGFVKFHVQQAIVLLIAGLVFSILGWVLLLIPIIGWIAYPLIYLALLALGIYGIIMAIQGETKELPVIGRYGERFNV